MSETTTVDVNPEQLQYELAQRVGFRSSIKTVAPAGRPTNDWLITVDDVDQADLEAVVENHVPDSGWTNPDDEAARTEWEDAVANASNLSELKDAILGTGTDARPEVSRKG